MDKRAHVIETQKERENRGISTHRFAFQAGAGLKLGAGDSNPGLQWGWQKPSYLSYHHWLQICSSRKLQFRARAGNLTQVVSYEIWDS